MKKILFPLFLLISFAVRSSDSLKIGLMTDVHYFSSRLADSPRAELLFEKSTGRNIALFHEVLDTVIAKMSTQKLDFLFIPGDLTQHGERQSHLDFVEKLKLLRQRGVRIFVIPGNHDVNIPNSKRYTADEALLVESVTSEEFADIYGDFGYTGALSRDTASLSYLAALTDSIWLLCFDTNRWSENETHSISGGKITSRTLAWALDILREAKEKNITVLGMMHHGLVEHVPYQASFFADYLIPEWKKTATTLADAGLQIVFTGHFHANDITRFASPTGNTVYDIATGSLAQYPFPYRMMTFDGKRLSIETRFVTSVSGMPDLQEQYQAKMEDFAREVLPAKLRRMGLSLPDDTRDALVDLLVCILVLHVYGDEETDDALRQSINNFAAVLGNEDFDAESFQLDFPPADNRLIIEIER